MYPVSVRLASYLNALNHAQLSAEVAASAITEPDVAHHVIDQDGRTGLEPLAAHPLETALPALQDTEPDSWLLALPIPGALGPLRGPQELNEAALQAGEAVIAATGGSGLVPYRVGPAVQWRVFPAERPFPAVAPSDAERMLNEAILTATPALDELEVASGSRPRRDFQISLAPGYSSRQEATAERASRLLQACDAALQDDGAAISSFEIDRRRRLLQQVRAAASDAFCAAVSFGVRPQRSTG